MQREGVVMALLENKKYMVMWERCHFTANISENRRDTILGRTYWRQNEQANADTRTVIRKKER